MPRSYDVKVAALTADAPLKWIDNLLSHHPVHGVERDRQGVERRISHDGLIAIELTHILSRDAGFTVGRAAGIVNRALQARSASELVLPLAPGVELRISVSEIEQRLRERLPDAIDAAPRVSRGRPPVSGERKTPDA